MLKADPDIILFKEVQKGNREAFNALFNKYYQQLCRFCFHYVQSKDTTEEIVQDVFVNVWQNSAKTEIKISVAAWLYTLVKNHALNYLKKEKTRKKYEDNAIIEEEDKPAYDAEKFKNELEKSMQKLPEKCRLIFQLSKSEGLSYDEIAEYLGISKKTIENQMTIAFRKLKEMLLPAWNEIFS
jgi:RNA polymerase sigma-70 factor (ECF subfamily)